MAPRRGRRSGGRGVGMGRGPPRCGGVEVTRKICLNARARWLWGDGVRPAVGAAMGGKRTKAIVIFAKVSPLPARKEVLLYPPPVFAHHVAEDGRCLAPWGWGF